MTERLSKFSKILLFALCVLHFANNTVLALELDTSVDDEIRKKYNPSKLEQDMALPALPKILNESNNYKNVNSSNNVVKTPAVSNATLPRVTYTKASQSVMRLKKGTRIKLRLMNNVSDLTQKGAKLSFSSIHPVKTKSFTIPEGTIFKGYVANSHKPQLSGNGGLIVININSMVVNDEVQPINARVVRANSKHIFKNNIKGKRTYMKNVVSMVKPGHRFYLKMLNIAASHMSRTSGFIITPLSLASGVVVLGSDVICSPVVSLFKKGGSISLREGSEIEVKLNQDIFIYL